MQELQKNYRHSCLNGSEQAIEETHFFLNQRSAVNDVNFQQTLQREAF